MTVEISRWCRISIGMLLVTAGIVPLGTAAARARSVWDGVYTDAQATRGEAAYRQSCALCHGPTLGGTETAPELLGSPFLKPYYGKSVQDLFAQVKEKMPKDAPGTLTAQQTVDVLAHLFKANKMPAGPEELPVTPEALGGIRIDPKPQ